MNNILGKQIIYGGELASYDAACKRLLSNRVILAWILKSCLIDIEAQKNFYPGYPIIMRGMYYGCRMISSQHGVEFTDSQYGNIKKVYSIWICMKPPKKRRGTINRYRMQEEFQIVTTGELEQEVRDMCNLSEGVLEQGIEIGLERGKREGHIDGIFTSLKNLMESMNWSAGQAMDALKIPKEERERYGRLLR